MLASLDEFELALDETMVSGKPLIVAFTATWCPPCKKIKPVYEQLVADFPELQLSLVDFDINGATVRENSIKSLPTFKVFIDGREVDQVRGGKAHALIDMLERAKESTMWLY